MPLSFSSDFFVANRRRLLAAVPTGMPIVVTANGLLQRGADNTYPFSQDANFWYLTGIEEPDITLVMHDGNEYLIASERTREQDIFDGSLNWRQLKQIAGIKTIVSEQSGWAQLQATLKKNKSIATALPLPPYVEQIGMYTNPARRRLSERITELNAKAELVDIRPQLASLRIIKQAPEVAAIRQAVQITCDAFNAVQQRQYSYEYQLDADLSQLFRSQGARGHAYGPIVAGGLNACTLHYSKNDARLHHGRLVLVDAGAQFGTYCADITRTWPLGRPTARQKAVLNAVNEAVEYGLDQLRPGVSFLECELRVRDFIGQQLRSLGVINRLTKHAIRQYYPHSPHYLGLDVHDVGDYKAPLEPGMVLTLEPGIYIPEEFIGVRIEENILITNKGAELLSSSLPRLPW